MTSELDRNRHAVVNKLQTTCHIVQIVVEVTFIHGTLQNKKSQKH